MDSIDRFIKKIEMVKENPSFSNLSILVSDLWAWSDQYETNEKNIQEMANAIELIIAIRLDEEVPLSNDDLEQIQNTLDLIIAKLKAFIS
jgi:hypothetical protein